MCWLKPNTWLWQCDCGTYRCFLNISLQQSKCQTKSEDPFDTTHSGTRTFLGQPFKPIEATRDRVFCPAHWQRGPTHTVSWAMAQSFCKWHDWNVKLSVSSYICLTTNGKARPQGMYKTVNQKLARSDFPKYARKCAVTKWSIITSRRWARFFARFCMRWVPSGLRPRHQWSLLHLQRVGVQDAAGHILGHRYSNHWAIFAALSLNPNTTLTSDK